MGYGNRKTTGIAQTNRYSSILNLDKYAVFSENGKAYFEVTELENRVFGYGRHTFGFTIKNIGNQQYQLKPKGEILLEIKDSNYTTIYSETTPYTISDQALVSFEIRHDQDPDACLSAFNDFQTGYQSSKDEPNPLFRRR